MYLQLPKWQEQKSLVSAHRYFSTRPHIWISGQCFHHTQEYFALACIGNLTKDQRLVQPVGNLFGTL